ncbi:MAG: hypothetical protein IJ523_00880 [Succinivibrionaceae bacterium]|nr:hypothetical protein [Succinivibrionaceae bacterium]
MKAQHSAIYQVMENLAENLSGGGSMTLAVNADPGKKYFSTDEKDLIQPGIYAPLGRFKGVNLLAGIEISWYSPGKIYAGVLATIGGFRPDPPGACFNDQILAVEILKHLEIEVKKPQQTLGGWIYWRYLTIDGRTTADASDSKIPHFKTPSKATDMLDDEACLSSFLTGALEVWNDLVARRAKLRSIRE